MNYNQAFNFNDELIEGKNIYTKYNGVDIILKNMRYYYGMATRQYVENGAIQSIIDNMLIIKVGDKLMYTDSLEYANKEYSINSFVKIYPDFIYTKFE